MPTEQLTPLEQVPMDPAVYFGGGHGWVTARQDGLKADCGGPATCELCKREEEYEAKKPPSWDELAEIWFWLSSDGNPHPDLPEDAIEIPHKIPGHRLWTQWRGDRNIVAVSEEMLGEVSNLPWPLEKVDCFADITTRTTYWRRTDR